MSPGWLELFEGGGLEAMEPLFEAHPEQADSLRMRLRMLAGAGLLDVVAEPHAFPARPGELELIRPDQLRFPKARDGVRRSPLRLLDRSGRKPQ